MAFTVYEAVTEHIMKTLSLLVPSSQGQDNSCVRQPSCPFCALSPFSFLVLICLLFYRSVSFEFHHMHVFHADFYMRYIHTSAEEMISM